MLIYKLIGRAAHLLERQAKEWPDHFLVGGVLLVAGDDKDIRHSMASDLPKRPNKCTNHTAPLC